MPPEDDKMPPQPPTLQLPAMTDRALLEDLTRVVKAGFAEVRVMRGDVDLLVGDLASLKVDVRELQKWKIGSEERQEKHSGGLQQTSNVNLKQDAAIAMVVTNMGKVEERLEAVETNQKNAAEERAETAKLVREIWTDGKTFFQKHPALSAALVAVGTGLAGALATWLHAFGGK